MGGGIYKRGDRWIARTRRGGLTRTKTCRTKREAQAAYERLTRQHERREMGIEPRLEDIPTLDGYRETYLAWARRHKSSHDRDRIALDNLSPTFGNARLTKITRRQVEAYLDARVQDGAAPRTANLEAAILCRVLSRALEDEVIPANPVPRFTHLDEGPLRVPILSYEDGERLVNQLPSYMAWFVRLTLATGMRRGELVDLRWADVDWDAGALVVRDSKTGASRRVPVPSDLLEELQARKGPLDAPVAPGHRGGPANRAHLSRMFRRYADRAGFKGLRFHDLRHVAASRYLSAGASLPEVAAILGHKTLVMAHRYAHAQWKRLQGITERAHRGD